MNLVKIGDFVEFKTINGKKTTGTVCNIYPVHEGSEILLAEIRVLRHLPRELANVNRVKVIDRSSLRWRKQ